jgi:Outer membrane protein beta-barrel domain
MKERIIFDDEFEKQLKEKADQFKMYPSDKVWNEVYSSLHTRRRRFVAGMTFLIGSILILAGSQLIFPSRNATPKPIAAKINALTKPATAADLHSFASSGFVSISPDNSNDPNNSYGGLNANPSFVLRSAFSSDQHSVPDKKLLESLPEKIQNTGRVKPIQTSELNVSIKSALLPLAVADLNDNELSTQGNPEINQASADLDPEKSVTQLTHIRNDRFSWEIYIEPTLNTHYLYGLNYQTMARSIQTAPIMVVHFANVNGLVDNSPAMGYNVGGNILYRISKNISLKAGVDFSFNRYYIKAYNSNQPQASASLSSYFGYVADSLVNSNTGGGVVNKNPQHYQNRYYQISLPLGVEMKVAGKGRLQLHLGGTLQPSYLLNTDAYVLSDDYNSYIKDAQAFRRWNLIAGAEAYVSYAVGKLRWEIGPQVRYQIFSTYKNSYPLQENMLNYGIRIGISKSIR